MPVKPDLAIVAVKAYDTPGAIVTLEHALAPGADVTILTPQNGVGNEELLAAAFGSDRVMSAALTVPVDRAADGTVVAANRGGLALAPVGSVAHNWLVAAFGRTPIPVNVLEDYRSMKWSKLALNVIANASCAILDVMPDRLVTLEGAFELELRELREVRAVMSALEIDAVDLPRYPVRALFALLGLPSPVARALLARRIAGARGRKAPSLLLDLRAGKGRTEVEALNGAVAAAGASHGVATPVNAAFAGVLAQLANDQAARAAYRERPEALVAAVEAEGGEASK
jgi:2-dehydropantoate 2-reductase